MCFYKWTGCRLCLQLRPLPTSFRIPFLMPLVCLYLPGLLTAASQTGGWMGSESPCDYLWTQWGPGCPFFWAEQAVRLLPAQPCQEVSLQYWQHQMFIVQLPALWNHFVKVVLKWRRLKITIRCLLSDWKDLTSVVKCFFRSNFLKYALDFYFRWGSQDHRTDYSQSQNPIMVSLGGILKPIQFQLLLKSEECRHPGICSEFVKVWKMGSCDGCDHLHLLKTYPLPKKGEAAIWCDLEKSSTTANNDKFSGGMARRG